MKPPRKRSRFHGSGLSVQVRTLLGISLVMICCASECGCVRTMWDRTRNALNPQIKTTNSAAKSERPTEARQKPARHIRTREANRTEDTAKDVRAGNGRKKSKTLKPTETLPSDRQGQPQVASQEGREEAEVPGKKHDHAGYVRIIKNKAIDRVNKHRDVAQARYCRDLTTDQWSLTLYFVKKRTYRFVRYAWDAIDEKWDEAYVSAKLPVTRLKDHLRYSAQGKDCKILKGGRDW